MDVSKFSGFFDKIVPQIVARTGSKSSNVQRPSYSNREDTFVSKSGKDVSGQVLASASHGAIPIHRASEVIGNTFKDFAKNLAV